MRGCGCALLLVAPFWVGAYLVGGWPAVGGMALAGALVEAVLLALDRRMAR